MISLMENMRVFESSEDVILPPSSFRYSDYNKALPRVRRTKEEIDTKEDEQLHIQDPERKRKNHKFIRFERGDERSMDKELVGLTRYDSRPMELVFLSSGEIRARKDCLDLSNEAPTRQTQRSPRMEVSHLVSEESILSPKCRTEIGKEVNMVDPLKTELQKEKRRVLEKTSCLLEEQSKNQQLRDRVMVLEAQLAAEDIETSSKIRRAAREQEKQSRSLEKEQDDRVHELVEQIRFQKDDIARLKRDKIELKSALEQLKKAGSRLSGNQHYDTMEVAGLRADFDDTNRRIYEFWTKVKRWKSNSREMMQSYDGEKSDLLVFLEKVWLDFPQLPEVPPRPHTGSPVPSSESQQQSMISADEQTNVVLFLKKRLRQREEKLRQTQIKYVELKEMCARQCLREADLQNFINEHRLRGNLIIRKDNTSKSKGADNTQEQVQKNQHKEDRRSATLKITPGGDTTSASCYERGRVEKDYGNEEYSDDNDDREDEDKFENPLRTPEIASHGGRGRVSSSINSVAAQELPTDRSGGKRRMQSKKQQYQEELVERIRLRPSPSRPQSTAAQKTKSIQYPFNQPVLGDCPPRCGSHVSSLPKKAPFAAARTKRSVTTTASKGIRPWL